MKFQITIEPDPSRDGGVWQYTLRYNDHDGARVTSGTAYASRDDAKAGAEVRADGIAARFARTEHYEYDTADDDD